jgi:hypothetical protein
MNFGEREFLLKTNLSRLCQYGGVTRRKTEETRVEVVANDD